MAEIKVFTRQESRLEGTASTLKDADIRGAYAEAVEKFVRDNASMGEGWQIRVLDLLLNPIKTPGKDGDLRGSSSYMNVFIAQLGIPLITLQKLRQAYKENENQTPFPDRYVETGLALIPGKDGNYKFNGRLALKLASDFSNREIEIGRGRVPDFVDLRLVADKEIGLEFRLGENATRDSISNLVDYNWDFIEESGLFRAYLWSGDWAAYGGDLELSGEYSWVVRYDAEGVAPKKLIVTHPDRISERLAKFRSSA